MAISGLKINERIRRLVCSYSGEEVDAKAFQRPVGLCSCCPAPGKPVVVEYELESLAEDVRRRGSVRSEGPGIWAYQDLLPVQGVTEAFGGDVGRTPTLALDRMSDVIGVDLWVKTEGVNPSGSFKDRGLSVAVALGAACGARRFCLPTQGNAGVAGSLFSARLGLDPCLVYMPVGHRDSIYHREADFFGAEVRFFGENIAASGHEMRRQHATELASGEFVDISTFFEPGRLEGKKTMGLELVEHFGPENLPDFIFYPTGGGTGLVGIWKALQELEGLGIIDPDTCSLPRLVAVQAEGCAPVVRSFEKGLDDVESVTSQGTLADGLDVPGAIMGHGILRAIRESGGSGVAVGEGEIVSAFRELGKHGIPAGYESAALLAAFLGLRNTAEVPLGSRVLFLLTSNHLIALGQGPLPSGA